MTWEIDPQAVGATAAFALVHSLLATTAAKDAAARWWGDGFRIGWYRVLFIVQSAVCTGLLGWAVFGHASPVLWEASRTSAIAMRLGQLLCLLLAVDCARRIGFAHVTGIAGLRTWLRGRPQREAEPEAQGPRLSSGRMAATGLFRFSRHPLNLLPVPILWLQPTMTVAMASAFTVATVYFVLGSWHEERRLRRRHGAAYERYRRSGPGFYLPWRAEWRETDRT